MTDQPPASSLQGDSSPAGTVPALLVLDLGTTTLVGRLLDSNGKLLAESRSANPQRSLGADILTRLQRAQEGAGAELQRLLVDGVRALVASLLDQADRRPDDVAGAAAAGNPGISHLLLGLPVASLLFPPHRSTLTTLTILSPEDLELGLAVPLQLFPAVSGFVGGDLVAVLFGVGNPPACGHLPYCAGEAKAVSPLWNRGDGKRSEPGGSVDHQGGSPPAGTVPTLVLDLGTNAELALWNGERWWVTSAAAGPTFEAGNIACGMPLETGAVTDVQLQGDRLALTVAAADRPAGLCGSGLMALVAAARQGGLIDVGGRIVSPGEIGTNLVRYLMPDGEGWALCFHRDARGDLRLTQNDVRQLQLAKGAVRAGIEVLLDRTGLTVADLGAILITGAFGSALPADTLKGIAMLPEGMVDKSFFVPNGVLDGLGDFLCDVRGPERVMALLATIKPFPLSGTPAFEKRFLKALDFS